MTPIENISDRADQINEYQSSYLKTIHAYDYFELIKKPEVLVMTCSSKSKHHTDIIKGLMVPSIAIGSRSVAYLKYEVLAVIAAQIKGQSDDEIRSLVKQLVAQRQNLMVEVQS